MDNVNRKTEDNNHGSNTTDKMPKKLNIFVIIILVFLIIVAGVIIFAKKKGKSFTKIRENISNTAESNETSSILVFDKKGATSDPFNDPNGPYYHQIYTANSTNGIDFTRNNDILIENASVPDTIMMPDGTLYAYAVDGARRSISGILVARSKDNGATWEQGSAKLSSSSKAVADPEVVLLEDGSIRMYYIVAPFVPMGQSPDPNSISQVKSAISTDGVNFTEENGIRFEYAQITDPDLIKIDNTWHMYLSQGPRLISTTSKDGMSFSYSGVIREKGSVSKTVSIDNGEYRQFYCDSGIKSATTLDGITWQNESGTRIEQQDDETVCDPSPIQVGDNWLMLFKSAPLIK